ncbi:MAG: hypothetical protein JW751_10415 [Polyangiaceae bacterium]|nr:hypothetical protein [Polyangiaceae bacterium]
MADRYNFFELAHKPFRLMWMELVVSIGVASPRDEAELARLEARVEFATEVYAEHNRDESDWYGSRLCELDPDLAARWRSDHDDHLRLLESLRGRTQAVRVEPAITARAELLADLYRFFCEFVADDLAHMSLEEGEIMSAFQAAYDDGGLRELEAEFVAERVSPAAIQRLTPLFLRACNADERASVLALLQRRTSADTFDDLMGGVVANVLPPRELAEVRARLGFAAA